VTHSWELDRRIVESVRIPAIIAGGLGPENVRNAIRVARPAGVDSKTKTDRSDGTHTKDLQKSSAFVTAARSPKEASSRTRLDSPDTQKTVDQIGER
jgi:phosphoribosylanthranilate isomerase